MAVNLDEGFLRDVGLADLRPDVKREFLDEVREALELRIGTTPAHTLTDAQLDGYKALKAEIRLRAQEALEVETARELGGSA